MADAVFIRREREGFAHEKQDEEAGGCDRHGTVYRVCTVRLRQQKPTEKDARDYVKATLDIIMTGDYEHSVKFSDVSADEAKQMRADMLDQVGDALTGDSGITYPEETIKAFRDVMDKGLQKCRFTVGDAVAADEGFDVTVTVEPLVMMDSTDTNDKLMSYLLSVPGVTSMSQEELSIKAVDYIISLMGEGLDNPTYEAPVQVTVHYGELEDGQYGVSEADGERLGEKPFVMK